MKNPTSIRLSDTAKEMLRELAARRGLSQSGVLETLIREAHERPAPHPALEGP